MQRKVRSQSIRRSARDEPCTGRLIGCEGRDTTVFAHAPHGDKGMRTKGHDFWGAYLCMSCHSALDQHQIPEEEITDTWLRAIAETQRRLIRKGLLEILP